MAKYTVIKYNVNGVNVLYPCGITAILLLSACDMCIYNHEKVRDHIVHVERTVRDGIVLGGTARPNPTTKPHVTEPPTTISPATEPPPVEWHS